MPAWAKFLLVVGITSAVWIISTFITKPENKDVLRSFYKKIQPGGPGWKKILNEANAEGITLEDSTEGWSVPSGIIAMLLGCVLIYSSMFATGYYIYGDYDYALPLTVMAITSGVLLVRIWKKIKANIL